MRDRKLSSTSPPALAVLFASLLAPTAACGEGRASTDAARPDDALGEHAADGLTDDAARDSGPSPDGLHADAGGDASAESAQPIASQRFSAPTPWAEPIADYLAAGQAEVHSLAFSRGIHDLRSYAGRLYLGFGDANLNLGRIFSIDFRSLRDPDDPSAVGEFISDEEQLDRYRRVGEELWMAGVDATEDGWLGNVYRRSPSSGWVKLRTVQNGVHVHDVAGFQGAVYAVGSGGTPEEWGAGDIYGHLWRSDDRGERWEIVHRQHNDGGGDARYTRLLAFDTALFVFGYTSNAEGLIDSLPHGRWDGGRFTPLAADHPLARAVVLETDRVDRTSAGGPARGLVRTRDFSSSPAVQRSFWLDDQGVATPIAAFDRPTSPLTVVDLDVVEETGELLALTVDGSDWLPGPFAHLTVRAWVSAADGDSWSQVFALETTEEPESIAWWRGKIYLGTTSGQVWRAVPE